MNTDNPKPLIFTVLGYFYILVAFTSIFAIKNISIFFEKGGFQEIPPGASSFSILLAIIGIPIFIVLYFLLGFGFLKLKRWLPKFLLIVVVIGFLFKINNYFAFPHQYTIESTMVKDLITLVINLAIIGYTLTKKHLFIN